MFFIKTMSIVMGSFLQSLGINLFLLPNNLLDGGIIGLSIITYYLFGIKVGIGAIILNIPIFIIGWLRNRRLFYNSLHGMLLSNCLIDLYSSISYPIQFVPYLNPSVNSVIGGVLVGTGVGVMLKYNISTDGSELLAQIVSGKTPLNIGFIILIMDIFILFLGEMVFPSAEFFLSLQAVFFAAVSTGLVNLKNPIGRKRPIS